MSTMGRFARVAAAVTAAAGLAVTAACGSGSGNSDGVASLGGASGGDRQATTTTTVAPQDALVQYARCMRDNGIPMKDPDPNGGAVLRVGEHDAETLNKAEQACKQFLPRGVEAEDSAQTQDRLREMAQCMRTKGYNVSDPKLADPGSQGGGAPQEDEPEFDINDPAFKAAERECSKKAGLEAPPGGPTAAGR